MNHVRLWSRRLAAPLVAALTLTVALGLTATPARAQNGQPPPAEGEDTGGRSGDGYIATGCLAGLALFLVAKSARRSAAR